MAKSLNLLERLTTIWPKNRSSKSQGSSSEDGHIRAEIGGYLLNRCHAPYSGGPEEVPFAPVD